MTKGKCRRCEKQSHELISARRTGGGNYRRPSREYRSSICLPCARELLARAPTHAGATIEHWSVLVLRHAVKRVEDSLNQAGQVK